MAIFPARSPPKCTIQADDNFTYWRNIVFAQAPDGVSSSFPRKRGEACKSLFPSLLGVCVGIFIGISFMKFNNHFNNPLSRTFKATEESQVQENVRAFRPPAPLGKEPSMVAVDCSVLPPRGTNGLPRGIVVPLTDLYPRRLWGNPKEDLLLKPKYLLTLTVGLKQKDFVNQCVQKFSRDWQIVLFHYDGKVSEWDDLDWAKYAIRISTPKQAKWWYAKRFLHPDVVEAYEYIFIWDEDLDVEHFNAEKYVELIKKYDLEISQPGIEPDKGLTWEMTKRRGDSEVHKETQEKPGWCEDPLKPPCAGFVEIMAPVFSRSAWRCVWHMIQNDLVHGWGLDMSLQRCAQPAHEKIGVVDAQWVRHRVVPSLGESGQEDPANFLKTNVRERCKAEWKTYKDRLQLADEQEQAEKEKEKEKAHKRGTTN